MCRISALYLGIKELVLTYLAVTVLLGDVEGPGFGGRTHTVPRWFLAL